MSTDNGKAPAAALDQPAAEVVVDFDPGKLAPWDLIRATRMLADQDPELGGGKSGYDLMDEGLFRNPLVYWCLRTRVDPAFTWEQALRVPYETYIPAEDDAGPPPTGGGSSGSAATTASPPRPAGRGRGRRAATSSG